MIFFKPWINSFLLVSFIIFVLCYSLIIYFKTIRKNKIKNLFNKYINILEEIYKINNNNLTDTNKLEKIKSELIENIKDHLNSQNHENLISITEELVKKSSQLENKYKLYKNGELSISDYHIVKNAIITDFIKKS